MADRIKKSIEINAPVSRVWRALTDHREFSQWFRVMLETPFKVGETVNGPLPLPDHNRLWEATILKMAPERYFSLTWHPFAIEAGRDYSSEPPTLVEFTLQPTMKGTLLRVVESGFASIPSDRRATAFRAHDKGWVEQLRNIADYVEHNPERALAS